MSTQACLVHLEKLEKISYTRKLGVATPAPQLAGPTES